MSGHAVFMTHSGLIRMDAVFARALRERMGCGSVAVVHGKRDRSMAEGEEAFDSVIDVIEGFHPEGAARRLGRNLGLLAEMEREKGDSTFFQDIYQDRWLSGRFDLAFQADYLAHGIERLREVLAGDLRVVMGEMTMALYRTARRMALGDAPYLYPLGARFFERFYFEDDLEMGWNRCRLAYDRYLGGDIPDEARRHAERVLGEVVDQDATIASFAGVKKYTSPGGEPVHAKLGEVRRLAHHRDYWRHEFPERARNPKVLMSPWQMSPPGMVLRWTREWKNFNFLKRHALSEVPADAKFAIYFLHYQPEYTVEGVGFPVANQAVLIRTIAQSLPVDMLLLVKEQPWMTGRRSASFYREILALPNVRLVRETVSSRELIKRSRCVFAISGTAALEALFFNIPAVLFSRVFHSNFRGITRVLNLYTLRDHVHALLTEKRGETRASSLAALAAMYSESRPGRIATEIADVATVYNQPNVERLGDALLRELQQRGKKK